MPDVRSYQQQLLAEARRMSAAENRTLSAAVEDAFLATPRHRFVTRYRTWENSDWQTVTRQNLAHHLPTLYSNNAIALYGADDGSTPSTISQPSLVLYMLDLLQLAPRQRVFELGAGSGWNAAMMGRLVQPGGQVYSVEIIAEMAQRAANHVAALGIDNVTILHGDGGGGYAPGAPYDRAIFTAGAYDLPEHFYTQLSDGALLLFVLKTQGSGDTLFLLQKTGNHFVAHESLPVGFVPMTGHYAMPELQSEPLSMLPDWATLQAQEVARRPFWWGGYGSHLLWRTQGIRSFLSIVEPWFRIFRAEAPSPTAGKNPEEVAETEEFFGLWDKATNALVIARHDELITYGNLAAQDRLLAWLRRWIEWGMPAAAAFALRIYPAHLPIQPADNEWIVKRTHSQFLWRLNTPTS